MRWRPFLLIIAIAALSLLPTGCLRNNKVSGSVIIAGGTREYAQTAAAGAELPRSLSKLAVNNQRDLSEWVIPNELIVRYAFSEALTLAEAAAQPLSG
ncbi:MAG TPA: hypothetical protein DER58_01215, partial [Firmicutes bacterium]|nr:hypothetical protein [Bacillota bacterium]